MQSILVSRDSKGKIRVVTLRSEVVDGVGHIYRSSGLWSGKKTEQPTIDILSGKAKRDVCAQTELQFMSLRKKQLDKGYIELPDDRVFSDIEVEAFVGKDKTNQQGVIKPMLAKQADKVTNPKIFDKQWLGSRKIDGTRCLLYLDGTEVKSASRGGTDYDMATYYIRTHPSVIELFHSYPTLILDGELFKMGKSLQQISGAVRNESIMGCDWLEYWIYDLYDSNNPNFTATERQSILLEVCRRYGWNFDPNKEWKEDECKIQKVPQTLVSGWNNMNKLHDQYVSEGFEGLVIRDPVKPYKPGGRSNDMIKIKSYFDSTVRIIGKEPGLRGFEDMVFICQMKDGSTFKAKPVGDKNLKQEYWNNFEDLCQNQIGELKYFYLSDNGTPLQPTMKCIRYDLSESEL